MPSKDPEDPCVDCKIAEAFLSVRRRRLCRECFIYYVNSKCLKRMEPYRIRNATTSKRRKLLLPVSGGVSSLVLLSILDQQLLRQSENSRGLTAYDLAILLIDTSSIEKEGPSSRTLTRIQEAFPRHRCFAVPLSDVFKYERGLQDSFAEIGVLAQVVQGSSCDDKLHSLISQVHSSTASEDVVRILTRRLIVAYAQAEGCESILWGDSDSRLASRALANVAKGRGSSLPWDVCDGPTPLGITFNFPLRELSKSELTQYSSSVPSSLNDLVISTSKPREGQINGRNFSINDLMDQYIETQGEKYPSIMANVVRTVNKLQRPPLETGDEHCRFCGISSKSIPRKTETSEEKDLCYGCVRLRMDFDTRPATTNVFHDGR